MDSGDYEAALEEYLQLTEKDPQNPRFLLDLADIYKQLHMDDKALETALEVLNYDKNNQSALLMSGSLYKKAGQLEGAEKMYKQLLLSDKSNYMALFSLSVIKIKNKQWHEAKEYLAKALEIKQTPDLYNNLGLVEIKGFNNYESGIKYLKIAVKIASNKTPYQKSLNNALKHH
jgi:tetratricopeptide (TPR) repeat protein